MCHPLSWWGMDMHKAKTLLARLAAAAIAFSVAVPFGVAFAEDALGDVDTPNDSSTASSAVTSDSSLIQRA